MTANLVPLIDPRMGASLIKADARAIGPILLEAAYHLGGVDEVFAYRQEDGAEPKLLASCSALSDLDRRVSLYTQRFHRFDPAGGARLNPPPQSGFVCTVRVDEIAPREYRAICFERPRFMQKICCGWRADHRWLVVSYYCRRKRDLASDPRLTALSNLALSKFASMAEGVPATHGNLVGRVMGRLALACPQLTRRELEVCGRTLAGSTAARIAADLCISRHSVLTYRQRAYRRMQVTQASGLLEYLLE